MAVGRTFASNDRPQARGGVSRHPHLASGDKVRERIGARRHYQRRDLTIIGDLDGLAIGDMTQNGTALIAHLTMSHRPHVAQRSTLCWSLAGGRGRVERRWPNAELIESIELVRLIEDGDEVVVTYESRKVDGSRFRNTEVLTFAGERVAKAEVYFGWNLQ